MAATKFGFFLTFQYQTAVISHASSRSPCSNYIQDLDLNLPDMRYDTHIVQLLYTWNMLSLTVQMYIYHILNYGYQYSQQDQHFNSLIGSLS